MTKFREYVINVMAGAVMLLVFLITLGMIGLVSLGIMRILEIMFRILGF